MKNYLILEDHQEQAKALSILIKKYQSDVYVHVATAISQALQSLEYYTFDVFFLNIQLSETNALAGDGIKFGQLLRTYSYYQDTPIIYVTSFAEHMSEAINNVHCYGFLQKPYRPADVHALLDSLTNIPVVHSFPLRTNEYIIREIFYSDLLYVHSKGRYLYYHTLQEVYTSRQYTIQTLLDILPDYFIRCHKSHLFNYHYFVAYDTANQCVRLQHYKEPIPVGRNYKDTFIGRFL